MGFDLHPTGVTLRPEHLQLYLSEKGHSHLQKWSRIRQKPVVMPLGLLSMSLFL